MTNQSIRDNLIKFGLIVIGASIAGTGVGAYKMGIDKEINNPHVVRIEEGERYNHDTRKEEYTGYFGRLSREEMQNLLGELGSEVAYHDDKFSGKEIVDLIKMNISPSEAKDYLSFGRQTLTAKNIIDLDNKNIKPEDVYVFFQEFGGAVGFNGDDITSLMVNHVDPKEARRILTLNAEYSVNISCQDIVELKRQGLDYDAIKSLAEESKQRTQKENLLEMIVEKPEQEVSQ